MVVCIDLVFLACTQVIVWLLFELSLAPTVDPYIPRAKRPPAYLSKFLLLLNDAIDRAVDFAAPFITTNRHARRSSGGSSLPDLRHIIHVVFDPIVRPFIRVYWFLDHLFAKTHFCWWRVRHRRRPPPTSAQASSAVADGLARAQAAVPSQASTRTTIFDSDSFDILIDGGATASISNSLEDFVTPPVTSSVRVKGFNGTTSATRVGTVIWHILDDSGRRHALEIPHTFYAPASPMCLLSPQHYAQELNDDRGTFAANFGDQVVFMWKQRRFRATVSLGANNVGILRSAPGAKVFSFFVGPSSPPSIFACTVITDDEGDVLDAADDDDSVTY